MWGGEQGVAQGWRHRWSRDVRSTKILQVQRSGRKGKERAERIGASLDVRASLWAAEMQEWMGFWAGG